MKRTGSMIENSSFLDCDELLKAVRIKPLAAIVLGSGLGKLADDIEDPVVIPYARLSGFPVSTVEGHEGSLIFGKVDGVPVVCMKGRVHYYEGYSMQQVTYPVRFLKRLGVEHLILTNAAGGIRAGFKPGTLMIVEDHISSFVPSPFGGIPVEDYGGTQFVDMSEIYTTEILRRAAEQEQIQVEQGIYLQTTGPGYETPAEIRMYRTMGADAVGMSTTVEAAMAHALKLKVHAVSCITNPAAGLGEGKLSHEEVKIAAAEASDRLLRLVHRALQLIGQTTGDAAVTEPPVEKKEASAIQKKKVLLYTDGSARSNPDGPGGYGSVLMDADSKEVIRELSQGYQKTTNNRMELMAVIAGLEFLKDPCIVDVYSDSQYVVNSFEKKWLENWIRNNWMRGKEPVKNVDLWKKLLFVMESHQVTFHWVKGHAGNPMNERCDELATYAADNGPWIADTAYIESLK